MPRAMSASSSSTSSYRTVPAAICLSISMNLCMLASWCALPFTSDTMRTSLSTVMAYSGPPPPVRPPSPLPAPPPSSPFAHAPGSWRMISSRKVFFGPGVVGVGNAGLASSALMERATLPTAMA